MTTLRPIPYRLAPGEGPKLSSLGVRATLKATSEQTGGVFNLVEALCPPGYATPLHIHYAEDVVVYLLEGRLTAFWGDECIQALPGAYFFQPRGTPHGFRVEGETPARILYLTIPAGFDRLVTERGDSAPPTIPPAPAPPAIEAMAGIVARYKIEVLGPLPASAAE